jgi:hypothetical protein
MGSGTAPGDRWSVDVVKFKSIDAHWRKKTEMWTTFAPCVEAASAFDYGAKMTMTTSWLL